MAKSTYLNLELTNDDPYTTEWCGNINGVGEGENKSNAQLVDEFAGKFAGGSAGKVFVKSSNNNFEGEWRDIDNASKITISTDGEVSALLSPDKFYDFTGDLTSLSVALNTAVVARENEYKGQFATGATVPTVTFPENIVWVGGFPMVEANKKYQFSILNSIGVIVGV